MSLGRKVFRKEDNMFVTEIDVTMTMSTEYCDIFLKMRSLKELKLLLETQVENENFEMADKIQKLIKQKEENTGNVV